MPTGAPANLFSEASNEGGDPDEPIRPDGHLRLEWVDGGWSTAPGRLAKWAHAALEVALVQQAMLAKLPGRPLAGATARSESTAELLCAELSVDGLPMDRSAAEGILAGLIGPRPRSGERSSRDPHHPRRRSPPSAPPRCGGRSAQPGPGPGGARQRRRRGARHPGLAAPRCPPRPSDRRCPPGLAQDRTDRHHLRLRVARRAISARTAGCEGCGRGCDGAAGRMTASAGLHNMPAEIRGAVDGGGRPRLRAGRSRPDRASRAGRGLAGPVPGPGDARRATCTRQ